MIYKGTDGKILTNVGGDVLKVPPVVSSNSTYGVTKDGSNLVSAWKDENRPFKFRQDDITKQPTEDGDGIEFVQGKRTYLKTNNVLRKSETSDFTIVAKMNLPISLPVSDLYTALMSQLPESQIGAGSPTNLSYRLGVARYSTSNTPIFSLYYSSTGSWSSSNYKVQSTTNFEYDWGDDLYFILCRRGDELHWVIQGILYKVSLPSSIIYNGLTPTLIGNATYYSSSYPITLYNLEIYDYAKYDFSQNSNGDLVMPNYGNLFN